MISAEIIADSTNQYGHRITTFVATFPRIILAEFNTHRMFSRNSASSRAIPFEKMVKSVEENPFIPIAWQKDHKGMQGAEYLSKNTVCELQWLRARDEAVFMALQMSKEGLTKQICNRLLEPFLYHTVIVTATEWENFFALRCPQYWLGNPMDSRKARSRKDAQKYLAEYGFAPQNKPFDTWTEVDWLKMNQGQAEIHMMALAEAMWDAYNESTPKELKADEWHIPFGDDMDLGRLVELTSDGHMMSIQDAKIKITTARCARVSYLNFEGKDDYAADIKLHDRLAESGHWSPFEHCAQAMPIEAMVKAVDYKELPGEPKYVDGWCGNFRGFVQYRKLFPNENITNASIRNTLNVVNS